MRFWVGVSAAFGAGTLVGIVAGALLVEDKLKKEYVEANAAYRRAMEAARIDAETPVHTEEELSEPLFLIQRDPSGVQLQHATFDKDGLGHIATGSVEMVDGQTYEINEHDVRPVKNPYHEAVVSTSAVYASYAELDEEEWLEEDGRVKDQITMIFDDGVARFFNNGEEIDDAFERVGGSIVDDMRKAVGEGNPIIYVRNNNTEVDYEVSFEQP